MVGRALGWRVTHDDGDELVLEPPAGSPEDGVSPDLLFGRVTESKEIKNRLHIDLRPDDHVAELERALAMGARRVDIGQGDQTWEVLGPGRQRVLHSPCADAGGTRRQLTPALCIAL